VENADGVIYAHKGVNPQGGCPTAEYFLAFDAAKHVALMSNGCV
jgi:hypothetical protein